MDEIRDATRLNITQQVSCLSPELQQSPLPYSDLNNNLQFDDLFSGFDSFQIRSADDWEERKQHNLNLIRVGFFSFGDFFHTLSSFISAV